MLDQIRVVFLKNFTLLIRSKVFIQSIYVPLLCTLFSCLAVNVEQFVPLRSLWPLYQSMAINGYVRYASMEIVQEKNEQQRENQKIMGLTHWSYMIGQVLFSIIVCLFFGLFYFLIAYTGGVYEGIDFGKGLVTYCVFVIAMVCQLYFFTSFFTNQKLASDILTLINLFFSFVYIIVIVSDIRNDKAMIVLLSLFPQAGLTLGLMADGWIIKKMMNISLLNFSLNQALLVLLFDAVIYLSIYLYIDQVWPNEYGTQKRPLFIFDSIKNFFCKQSSNQPSIQNNQYQQFSDIELGAQYSEQDIHQSISQQQNQQISLSNDRSSALYHQEIDTSNLVKSLEIKQLTKEFSGYYAVKLLSLNLYEGQIFCLLGHNGAGKTTTINLLTGMIEKSFGQVMMNGLDLDKDLDEIRRSIGLCSQKNILYDTLTVEDHLWYYARIKLIPEEQILMDIHHIINKCNLQNERLKYAQHLSGGNKRKLCLAIALIGKAKFIFLDEPTSGVDVVTRRQIWDILREIKNEGRVIILTTHHLEEAEALADRIGIMAQGQLLCVGTVDFIVHKFGVGYFLKIQSQSETEIGKNQFIQKKSMIEQIIKQFIPNCQKDPQTQDHSIKYLLPFTSSQQFSALFTELEKDVFVNIGLDEQKYINANQDEGQQNQDVEVGYSDFSNIQVPEFLKDEPFFSFSAQIQVMALRRIKLLIKNTTFLISFFFPLTIVGIGLLFAKNVNYNFETYCLFCTIAVCLLSNTMGSTFIIEREKSLLYTLRVMGCKAIPYWLGTFIVDFILSMIYFAIISSIAIGFKMEATIIDNKLFLVYKLFVLVFSGLATSYSYSYMFDKSYNAYMAFPFFQLFINYFLGVFCMILSSKFKPLQLISYIFFPLGVNVLGSDLSGEKVNYQDDLLFNANQLCDVALFTSICHLAVAIYFEKSQVNQICRKKPQYTPNVPLQREQDVVQEEQRTIQSKDPISAKLISKLYENNHAALGGITFGVKKKEIFGLLGPNGAGKTTTFNILTAKDQASSGYVSVNNQIAQQTNEEAWQNVGICSQIDCLWDDLTVYDHLYIYSSLKGLQGQKRERAISYFIQTLQLDKYVHKKSYQLSGGNKRKLCVGMALIGSPNVQFFDEPSSGLDPIAKRFLWNTLKQNLQLKNASIVLTTHSMNEAESLCQKIGILINGQFACMGSPEHLSNKYGQGYRLKLAITENCNVQEIDQYIFSQFQNAVKILQQEKTLIYQIPSYNFIFSRVFDVLENQLKKQVDTYSIHYTNLEQIFQYFASLQQVYAQPPESQSDVQVCDCRGANAIRWCTMCCCCCVW